MRIRDIRSTRSTRDILRYVAAAVAGVGISLAATVPGTAAEAATTEIAYTKVDATIRSAPTTASAAYTVLDPGESVDVLCWITGEPVYGTDRYGSMWLKIDGWAATDYSVAYVHSYLVSSVDVPEC